LDTAALPRARGHGGRPHRQLLAQVPPTAARRGRLTTAQPRPTETRHHSPACPRRR
jgi:hypothetical protein